MDTYNALLYTSKMQEDKLYICCYRYNYDLMNNLILLFINLAVLQVCPGHAHGLSLDEGRNGRDRRECLGAPCLFPECHFKAIF